MQSQRERTGRSGFAMLQSILSNLLGDDKIKELPDDYKGVIPENFKMIVEDYAKDTRRQLDALKFGPDGKVDLEAMLRTHIADLSRNAHRQPPSYNVFMAADPENILDVEDRSAFRDWLAANHETATECWIAVKRGRARARSSPDTTSAWSRRVVFL